MSGPPLPSPSQPRLAKRRAPSLGSLTSYKSAHPQPSWPSPNAVQMSPSQVPKAMPSPLGPPLTPHLLTCLPSPSFALRLRRFPPNPALRQTPQRSPPPPSSSLLTRAPSPSHTLDLPWACVLLPLSSPHLRQAQVCPSVPALSPHPPAPPPALRSSPSSPGPAAAPPAHLGGRGGASSPGGRRAAGQRPLAAGEGSAAAPQPSQLVPDWEPATLLLPTRRSGCSPSASWTRPFRE